jgi:hypothetical protein
MKWLKKYWYIITLLCITIGLGVVTYLTSQKLTQTTPVAPNVPQQNPKAAVPACTYTFTIQITSGPTPTVSQTPTLGPSSTPTNTPHISLTPSSSPTVTTIPSSTPTITITSTPTLGPSSTPTNTPLATNTPTGTTVPQVGCNISCTSNSCQSGLVCDSTTETCRNNSCIDRTDCICLLAQATPTSIIPQTPVSGGQTFIGYAVVAGGILLLMIGLAL